MLFPGVFAIFGHGNVTCRTGRIEHGNCRRRCPFQPPAGFAALR
jgi:hypothetical protein